MALKNEILGILVLIFLFWFILLLIIFFILSLYSFTISIIFLVFSIFFLLRNTINSVLFPGSSKYISRLFQYTFSKDLISDYISHLTALEGFLLSLDKATLYIDNKSLKACHLFIKQNLTIFKQSKLRQNQKQLVESLLELKLNMKNLKLRDSHDCEATLWSLIKNPGKIKGKHKMKVIGNVENSIICLCEINDLLQSSFMKSILQVFWFKGIILGDLENRRIDLFCRFNITREFLRMDDNFLIDTIFIKSETEVSKDTAVLYCLPNAGYYEYLYYQSSWIDFYLKSNINILLFNYRGYGNSQGSPSIPRLSKDCGFLITHLKKSKGYKQVILHGESIGGAIATLAASTTEPDILISDRTFSSTRMVFSQYTGSFLSYIMTLIGPANSNIKSSFESIKIAKILTYDPFDDIISIKSSLITGISQSSNTNFPHQISKNFNQTIKSIKSFISPILKELSCEVNYNFDYFSSRLEYLSLNLIESNFVIKEIYLKFFVICGKIDSAGYTLAELIEINKKDDPEIWLKNLLFWGSRIMPARNMKFCMRTEAILKLRKTLKDLTKLLNDYSTDIYKIKTFLSLVQSIQSCLNSILMHLEGQFLQNNGKKMLLVLSCGHSGSYNKYEDLTMRKFLNRLTKTEAFTLNVL